MSLAIFSSKDEDSIEKKVEAMSQRTDPAEIESVYSIKHTVQWIQDGQYKRIALQFPDELMGDAVLIAEKIGKQIEGQVFILGDTAYGSCCVDEVAAEHFQADSILHYGHACLSPTRRLPVLFVFGRLALDTKHCAEGLNDLFPNDEKVVIMYDTVYYYAMEELKQFLNGDYSNLIVSELLLPYTADDRKTDSDQEVDTKVKTICKCGRRIQLPDNADIDSYSMFYIGEEGGCLTNMIMTFNKCKFFSYNPVTKIYRQEGLSVNKALMKRFYLIEKAKDARIIGIVVGTLGVANYADLISQVKRSIRLAGKKSYTFVVGKLNVPKLANFMEIDIFVYVACPENTLIDYSEFYKPVITPYEMEMACNRSREWTGEVCTDFTQILPGGGFYVEMTEDDVTDEGDVSLITGKLRGVKAADEEAEAGAVVRRSELWTVSSQTKTAGEYLAERSWRGLEKGGEQTPVSLAIEGSRGIAIAYAGEGERTPAIKGTPKIAIEYEEENKDNG